MPRLTRLSTLFISSQLKFTSSLAAGSDVACISELKMGADIMEMLFGFMRLKKVQRVMGICLLLCVVLFFYSMMPSKKFGAGSSAIACKSKIAQLVMPVEANRNNYLQHLGKDVMSIENDFYHFMTSLTRTCGSQMHLGSEGDGGWDICMDNQFYIGAPCLVYSFGVADEEFLFEKAVIKELGCEVHAFDPSMGIPSVQFADKGYFYNYGLDSANTYAFDGLWKMRRLSTIMKELGHEGRNIDLLKMDIEFSEWTALHDMLRTGLIKDIRQLVMEIHTPEMDIHIKPEHQCTWSTRETVGFMLRTLIDLQNVGFSTYYITPNYRTSFKSGLTGMERLCCYNVHMVNLKHKENRKVID